MTWYLIGSQLLTVIQKKAIKDNKSLCLIPFENNSLKEWYKRNGFYKSVNIYYNFHYHYTRSRSKYLDKINAAVSLQR